MVNVRLNSYSLPILMRAEAKKITDRVVNLMEGVQNLRKAVYEYALICLYR